MDMTELASVANQIRIDIVTMLEKAGSGHPGGSLSSADIMCALYFGGVMNHDAAHPLMPERDRFVLAKGHAAPVLYATLARAGYIDPAELATLRKLGSRLQGHPDCNLVPGVEVSTGSLGQGLSIAAGIACGLRLKGNPAGVFALLGDGECQEGQVWEAAMFAAHRKLDALVAIVDRNGLQIDGRTADVCDPGDVGAKFAAFGWDVHEVDGHDIAALIDVLTIVKADRSGKPHAIIARTVKGKGVSFMEDQAGWHGKAPNAEQLAVALADLGAAAEEVEGLSEAETSGVGTLAKDCLGERVLQPSEQSGERVAEVRSEADSTAAPALVVGDPDQPKRATRAAYGVTLAELADEGVPVVAVDADLSGSTTTAKFASAKPEYAERLFNVGIAEQNMVDVAAGLSLEDISLMRGLPNMRVLVPADYAAARSAIRLAALTPGPVYVRMGRANVPAVYADGVALEIGRAYVLREGTDATIVACGVMVEQALAAATALADEGISVEVVDAFSIKPLDVATIAASAAKTGHVVVAEEHSIIGGLGSAVAEALASEGPVPIEFVGMRDRFGKSGEYAELARYFQMDSIALADAVKKALSR